eukprot:352428-Chlamydomonas_euryale.AAC.8
MHAAWIASYMHNYLGQVGPQNRSKTALGTSQRQSYKKRTRIRYSRAFSSSHDYDRRDQWLQHCHALSSKAAVCIERLLLLAVTVPAYCCS